MKIRPGLTKVERLGEGDTRLGLLKLIQSSRVKCFDGGIKVALDDTRKSDKVARICTYLFVEICTYFEYDAIITYIVFTITIFVLDKTTYVYEPATGHVLK